MAWKSFAIQTRSGEKRTILVKKIITKLFYLRMIGLEKKRYKDRQSEKKKLNQY